MKQHLIITTTVAALALAAAGCRDRGRPAPTTSGPTAPSGPTSTPPLPDAAGIAITTPPPAPDAAPPAIDAGIDAPKLAMVDAPIAWPPERDAAMLAYRRLHTDPAATDTTITPKMIVLHYTAGGSAKGTRAYFDNLHLEAGRAKLRTGGDVNVSAHFLVDRDGTIYKLMPEDRMARHAIGVNHVAIGVENVGDEDKWPLTAAQVAADAALIRDLKSRWPIEILLGHHEVRGLDGTPWFVERDPAYRNRKGDPGPKFMAKVRAAVADLGLAGLAHLDAVTERQRRLAAVAVVTLGLLAVAAWWRTRGARSGPTGAVVASAPARGVDVPAFRASLAQRRARASELQRRRASTTLPPAPRAVAGALSSLMLSPRCVLGPADLCATLADSVNACDDGDGAACLAVGQYLQDEAPRPMIALAFFVAACRHGEAAGCDRATELKAAAAPTPTPCAEDPLACAWQARRSHDDGRLDEACAAGVADACIGLLARTSDQPDRQRTYLEIACQLGSPMACDELGRRLSPDCDDACYPPDPAAAAAASTIACDVGFTEACARVPAP